MGEPTEPLPLVLSATAVTLGNVEALKNAGDLLTPKSSQLRDNLVERSENIERVAGGSSQQAALDMVRDLKTFADQLETERMALNRPLLDFQRALNQQCSTFLVKVNAEMARLRKLIGDFAQMERARLRDEQDAADRRIAEERAKGTPESQAVIAEIVTNTRIEAAPVAAGLSATEAWDYEITNDVELYKLRPEFFELKPRKTVISSAIRAAKGNLPLKGLVIRETSKVIIKK